IVDLGAYEYQGASQYGLIMGKVTDNLNLPISGAMVEAFNTNRYTDSQGNYALYLKPNKYVICARATGFYGRCIEDIEVATGSITIVNISLNPAEIIYVDDDNIDIELGTFDKPYNTINEGIFCCAAKGTVFVAGGEYRENIYIDKRIALIGIGTPTISSSSGKDAVIFSGDGARGAVISGFIINSGDNGIYCINSTDLTIANNIILKNSKNGIYCRSSSSVITGNTIRENGKSGISCSSFLGSITNNIIAENMEYGVISLSSSPPIIGNIIIKNGRNGINCSDSSPLISNNTIGENEGYGIFSQSSSPEIISNTISKNGKSGISFSSFLGTITNNVIAENNGSGIVSLSSSPIITNNDMVRNKENGIFFQSSSSIITNNIIVGNREGIFSDSSLLTINYNCLFGNLFGNYTNCFPGLYDISLDPQFVGFSDFHLGFSSPCIDSGTNNAPALPIFDKDGKERIKDGNRDDIAMIDMGAYEFYGTPTIGSSGISLTKDGPTQTLTLST
ncbi:MAG: right-handed parallel beta-helix repeat-containing protein, partial [bacterium]